MRNLSKSSKTLSNTLTTFSLLATSCVCTFCKCSCDCGPTNATSEKSTGRTKGSVAGRSSNV